MLLCANYIDFWGREHTYIYPFSGLKRKYFAKERYRQREGEEKWGCEQPLPLTQPQDVV